MSDSEKSQEVKACSVNQLNGFYEIKGLTTWSFPTDFKNEY